MISIYLLPDFFFPRIFFFPAGFLLAEYCFVTQIWLSLWPPISNSQMTQIFSRRLFFPQISWIYTDFLWLYSFFYNFFISQILTCRSGRIMQIFLILFSS